MYTTYYNMTLEYDKAIQELLDWSIIERNKDGELKPTADFLVWYYDFLIHDITETYGSDWEAIDDGEKVSFEDGTDLEEGDMTRNEFVKHCIHNQIVSWTAQDIKGRTYANLDIDKHVEIVYGLINDILARLMDTTSQKQKTGQKRLDDPS